jgi:hypothetical protein
VPRGGPKLEGAALFFFTHKLVLQAASFFFEGNIVTKKTKGRVGEGAANSKEINLF